MSTAATNQSITALVQSAVPSATLTTEYAGELVYRIPFSMSSRLADLFSLLQAASRGASGVGLHPPGQREAAAAAAAAAGGWSRGR
jgi:hypothetical protein